MPWATICPPWRPAAGTEIEQLVGAADHFAVVLDHQQRIAQVAELLQGVQQPAVVARVQADRRLVEHVEHAAQPAAHLGRQADALHLAAGERGGRPGQRQVFQAHVDQELQPVANFARHLAGDLPLAAGELPVLELFRQPAQRQAAKLVDRAAAKPHGRGVVAEPAAAADGTLDFVDQVLQLRAKGGRHAARLLQRRIEPFVLEAERGSGGVLRFRLPPSAFPLRPSLVTRLEPLLPVPWKISRRWRPLSSLERHVDGNARAVRRRRPASWRRRGCRRSARVPRRPGPA